MVHMLNVAVPEDLWDWMEKNLKIREYSGFLIDCTRQSLRNDPLEQEKKRVRQTFYEAKIVPELRKLQDTYEYHSNDYSFLLEHFGNQKIALSRNDLITCMDQIDQEVMAE